MTIGSNTDYLLAVEALTVSFDGFKAVNDLSFYVDEKDIRVISGRYSLFGAIYGTLLVNYAKTSFSESFPQLWLFGLGALFIGVVLLFPNGLAGIYRSTVEGRVKVLLGARAVRDDPADALQQPAE